MKVDTKEIVANLMKGTSPREAISEALTSTEVEDQNVIENPNEEITDSDQVDEASTVTKKVVRHGKVIKKKVKKYKKHKILTPGQRRAIKKAQQASQKSSARAMRRKSLKKAAAMEGELTNDEELVALPIICPVCGAANVEILTGEDFSDAAEELEIDDATLFVCPDCGKTLVLVDADYAEEEDSEDEFTDEDYSEEPIEGEEETVESSDCENCPDSTDSEDLNEEDESEPLYFEDDEEEE